MALLPTGNVGGDVVGPSTAVDSDLASFNGATGKIIKDSGLAVVTTLGTPGTDSQIPTAKAVRTAITSGVNDHGSLTGLTDDDHTQYTKKATLAAKGSMYAASAASTPAEVAVGANGTALVADSAQAAGVKFAVQYDTWNILIGDGVNEIPTGVLGYIRMDYAGAIDSVALYAKESGSLAVDIWKDVHANFPPTDADSITASAPPTLSAEQSTENTALTGWTKTFAAGDVFAFNVDSVDTITQATLCLKVHRT
ncbi:MAG: hypothetical protein WC683_06715 [bacterium]